MTKAEAIERVLDVFADRPSGPDGRDVLVALGVIERTADLVLTRECTLCGGGIYVVNGERLRHACRLP